MSGAGVLVTGLGVLSSIGHDVPSFTDAMRAGRSGIRPAGATFAARLVGFDAAEELAKLSIPLGRGALGVARRAPWPVQIAVLTAVQAWCDAGLPDRRIDPTRIGLVVAGSNLTACQAERTRRTFARDPRFVPPRAALHALDSDHVGVLSHVLGIQGVGHTVGAASASGGVAIDTAARLLATGAVDVCLVLGAVAELTEPDRAALTNLGVLATTDSTLPGPPFDRGHRGMVPGEGCACLVLESASLRGPGVAVLAGHSVALDGNSQADPSVEGERRAMAGALDMAGVAPAELSYVNTHGTGSELGDRTELAALRAVLGDAARNPVLNATKALTGHCLGAAGVVEAVATVIQLRGGFAHPNPGLTDPIEPGWRFAGAECVLARPRVALSNSFGFGGFNASAVFREPR
ncbi:MAG TPA: beta-ketoacyl synthase N-terminal-like domain-containing protein [Pseudonocardiaceae bacterium]